MNLSPALSLSYSDTEKRLYYYRATFEGNYDGDSLMLNVDLGFGMWKNHVGHSWIRLWGIDTPELRGIEREEGLKVRDFVNQLLTGKDILVHSVEKGKYGRWLAVLYIRELNVSVNEYLVQQGYAEEYMR